MKKTLTYVEIKHIVLILLHLAWNYLHIPMNHWHNGTISHHLASTLLLSGVSFRSGKEQTKGMQEIRRLLWVSMEVSQEESFAEKKTAISTNSAKNQRWWSMTKCLALPNTTASITNGVRSAFVDSKGAPTRNRLVLSNLRDNSCDWESEHWSRVPSSRTVFEGEATVHKPKNMRRNASSIRRRIFDGSYALPHTLWEI